MTDWPEPIEGVNYAIVDGNWFNILDPTTDLGRAAGEIARRLLLSRCNDSGSPDALTEYRTLFNRVTNADSVTRSYIFSALVSVGALCFATCRLSSARPDELMNDIADVMVRNNCDL